MVSIKEDIAAELMKVFTPTVLRVIDESAHHAGHREAQQGGSTHFHVHIVSKMFTDVSRLQRQRMVYAALSPFLRGPVHALSTCALAPGESAD